VLLVFRQPAPNTTSRHGCSAVVLVPSCCVSVRHALVSSHDGTKPAPFPKYELCYSSYAESDDPDFAAPRMRTYYALHRVSMAMSAGILAGLSESSTMRIALAPFKQSYRNQLTLITQITGSSAFIIWGS
jgi:hypothetical protein